MDLRKDGVHITVVKGFDRLVIHVSFTHAMISAMMKDERENGVAELFRNRWYTSGGVSVKEGFYTQDIQLLAVSSHTLNQEGSLHDTKSANWTKVHKMPG